MSDERQELEHEGLVLAVLEAEKDAERVRELLSALIAVCRAPESCVGCGKKAPHAGFGAEEHTAECPVRAAEQAFVYNVREMSPAQMAARTVLAARRAP